MLPISLTCKQGETFRRVLRFKNKAGGAAIDISGWIFRMDVREDALSEVAASAVIVARDQVTDKGAADLVVSQASTAIMQPVTHKFDLCADKAGERKFYIEGEFTITQTMTRG